MDVGEPLAVALRAATIGRSHRLGRADALAGTTSTGDHVRVAWLIQRRTPERGAAGCVACRAARQAQTGRRQRPLDQASPARRSSGERNAGTAAADHRDIVPALWLNGWVARPVGNAAGQAVPPSASRGIEGRRHLVGPLGGEMDRLHRW